MLSYLFFGAAVGTGLSPIPSASPFIGRSVYRSVTLSVLWVNSEKTSYCVCMPFGVVSRVGRGMGVLNVGPHPQREGDRLGFFAPLV